MFESNKRLAKSNFRFLFFICMIGYWTRKNIISTPWRCKTRQQATWTYQMLLLTKTCEITSGVVGPDFIVYGILMEIRAPQCHTLVSNMIHAQKKDFPLGFLYALWPSRCGWCLLKIDCYLNENMMFYYESVKLGGKSHILDVYCSNNKVKETTIPGVLVIEFDLPHDRGVIPVTEDYKWQSIVNIPPQLGDFLRKILLLTVHH